MARADDISIWDYARENGFAIVTKDADFSERVVLYVFPPKVIWIRRGNCSTAEIAEILRRNLAEIEAAAKDETIRYVILI